MSQSMTSPEYFDSIDRLIGAIRQLPSDNPVTIPTPGYNNYSTQKEHWLGWLDPTSGTGTFARRSGEGRGARYVYNHIREPMMLLWLISAAGVTPHLVRAAEQAANEVRRWSSKPAAIRRHVPWSEVAKTLYSESSV
jgi:hypothetical protein